MRGLGILSEDQPQADLIVSSPGEVNGLRAAARRFVGDGDPLVENLGGQRDASGEPDEHPQPQKIAALGKGQRVGAWAILFRRLRRNTSEHDLCARDHPGIIALAQRGLPQHGKTALQPELPLPIADQAEPALDGLVTRWSDRQIEIHEVTAAFLGLRSR